MPEQIIVALIAAAASIFSAICTIVVVLISNKNANARNQQQFEVAQAVMRNEIETLTREVRRHNNFAERMPRLEAAVEAIEEKISILHRGA